MPQIEIKKSYQGYVDLRDYFVKNAIKNNESITIWHKGEFMKLTPQDLVDKRVILMKEPVYSRFYPTQKYYLYSYKWQPKSNQKKLI